MNSFLLPQFFVFYRALPEQVRHQARPVYALFQQDPHHPSFRFDWSIPPVRSSRFAWSCTIERWGLGRAMTFPGSSIGESDYRFHFKG